MRKELKLFLIILLMCLISFKITYSEEKKLFYKVVSIETFFWVLLIVGLVYYFKNASNNEAILLP